MIQAFEPSAGDPKEGIAARGAGVRLESPEYRWSGPAVQQGAFAQDLAKGSGVCVKTPTAEISASGSGNTLMIHDGGEWRWFEPQG